MFPPLEEPERKSSFEIFVKINESEMIKFRILEKHEFRPSINIIIIRIGQNFENLGQNLGNLKENLQQGKS